MLGGRGALTLLLGLALCTPSSGCSFVYFIINCESKYIDALSSVSRSSKLPNLGRGAAGTLDFLANGTEVWVGWGPHLWLVFKVETVLWD